MAPTDVSRREDSAGGIANAIGPKLRLPGAKNQRNLPESLLRMRSSYIVQFFASRKRIFGPSAFAIPPLESSRQDASVRVIFGGLSSILIFGLITGVNGGQNGIEGYLAVIFFMRAHDIILSK